MRFGLFFQAPESPGRSHAERLDEMLELIALAESLGFDVARGGHAGVADRALIS